jgi:hypothetical protein
MIKKLFPGVFRSKNSTITNVTVVKFQFVEGSPRIGCRAVLSEFTSDDSSSVS